MQAVVIVRYANLLYRQGVAIRKFVIVNTQICYTVSKKNRCIVLCNSVL